MCAYNEFLVTRGTAAGGWDLREIGKIPADEKTKKCVLKMISRFEYSDYKVAGYFVMYDEMLGKFYCAQASEGKAVDERVNMSIVIRVPVNEVSDGFEECIQLVRAWEGLREENLPAQMICERYGIERIWLERFAHALYEQAFSQMAMPMGIVNSRLEWKQEESEFVTDMMKLCYLLLPSSKKFRLSFGWRVPVDKLSGVRLLFSERRELSKSFDVASPSLTGSSEKDSSMIARIVWEVLSGEKTEPFQDKIDQYYIQMANYESMCWNYWYYILDENETFSCTMSEFKGIRLDIRKQIQNGFAKASVLYEKMIVSLSEQDLTSEETRLVLGDYIGLCGRQKTYSVEQIARLWRLMRLCMGGEDSAFYQLLGEIRKSSASLYYALVKAGITDGYLSVLYLRLADTLETEADVQNWVTNSDNAELLTEPKVKALLMDILEPLFHQTASVKQIQSLMTVGYRIDKLRCAQIVDRYLDEGVRDASRFGSMAVLGDYLRTTESLWRDVKMYRAKMEEAYGNMAFVCQMPMSLEELRAFTEIPWDFANKQRVQLMLLEKCRGYLQQIPNGDEELEAVLRLLIAWETGIASTNFELIQCRDLLAKRKKVHLREKLETFSRQLECETKVEMKMRLLYKANEELDEANLNVFMEAFWGQVTLRQFAEIHRYEEELWKNVSVTPLNCEFNDNIVSKLYNVYARIYSTKSIESVNRDINMYLKSADGQITEEFLRMMLFEWVHADGEYFERILDVLTVCWDEEDELETKIEELVEDKKTAKQLIRKVQMNDFMGNRDKKFTVKAVGVGVVIWTVQMGIFVVSGEHVLLAGGLFGVTAILQAVYWAKTMKKEGN